MNYVVTLGGGSGIGSAIIGIVDALVYMYTNKINSKLIINTFNASNPVKIFITCFLDIQSIPNVTFINQKSSILNSNSKELFYTLPTNSYHGCNEINYICFDNFWKIKPQHVYSHPSDLCINIRRGDKLTMEPHLKVDSVSSYVIEMEKLHPTTIIHTSDDYATYLELKSLKPEWNLMTFCKKQDAGFYLNDFNNRSNDFVINHIDVFLHQLYAMKNAKYFIGSSSTNVGFLAKFLRHNQNMLLF